MGGKPIRVRLAHHLSPGDSLALSAAIRSLHTAYPGEYVVDLDCTARELYQNNPDVVKLTEWGLFGEVHYNSINKANEEPHHYLEAMCRGVSDIVKRPVPLAVNRPVLVLSEAEKEWSGPLLEIAPEPVPFALVSCGHKRDYSCKGFGPSIAQEVVDHFRGRIQFAQIGTSNEVHPKLDGVVDLIDRTDIRGLARLAYHSQFGVGPVTLLQLIYAALSKSYLCMAGGREARSWLTFPSQIDLSAHGMLDCCRLTSCWKSRVVPLGDNSPGDRSLCSLPVVMSGGETIPRCHQLVGSGGIVAAIDRLIAGGVIDSHSRK